MPAEGQETVMRGNYAEILAVKLKSHTIDSKIFNDLRALLWIIIHNIIQNNGSTEGFSIHEELGKPLGGDVCSSSNPVG